MNDLAASIAQFMTSSGLTLDDLAEHFNDNPSTDDGVSLRQYCERVLEGLKKNTADSYRPHLTRLCEGELRQCTCICATCVEQWASVRTRTCHCATCARSLSFEGLGERILRPKVINRSDIASLPEIAQRIATKRALHQNLKRAQRSLAPKPTHGQGAQEMCVTAMPKVFEMAIEDELLTRNPAANLEKGDRSEPRRGALENSQLIELFEVVVGGGDDPVLDFNITWTGLETGLRRGGILALTVGGLLFNRQAIEVIEKRNKSRIQPCLTELLEALLDMAVTRGGNRCTPGHRDFDPNAPVFYYKNSSSEHPHPLSDRRFDTLHARIQRSLPWANEAHYSGHALRHTVGTIIERIAGAQVASKMLGHGPKRPTDHYTKSSEEELATAWQAFSGRSHPSARSDSTRFVPYHLTLRVGIDNSPE